MSLRKLAYGIDFGTTNSTVALLNREGKLLKLAVDPEAENPAVMRSVIYVSPQMKFLFGKPAINAYLMDIAQGKGAVKKTVFTGRYIKVAGSNGRDQLVPEVIEVEESAGGRFLQALKSALSSHLINEINLFGKIYSIEELVGFFLKEMKDRADIIIGENIDKAVIGRPVEYVGGDNDIALKRMMKAARIAGFKEVKFEYEPVGAAYDYGISITNKQKALIFDFGGGTLDISIFKFPQKEALANVGLPIGGDHFNSEIFMTKIAKYFGNDVVYGSAQLKLPTYIFDSLQNWYRISLLKTKEFANDLENFRFLCSDIKAINALKSLIYNNLGFKMYEEIERVKKGLSTTSEEIYRFNGPDIEVETRIKKLEFEKIIRNDLSSIKEILEKSFAKAQIKQKDIDIVATTGGSSLIPIIRDLLIEMFGEEKIKKSDAFTSVASGLALMTKIS